MNHSIFPPGPVKYTLDTTSQIHILTNTQSEVSKTSPATLSTSPTQIPTTRQDGSPKPKPTHAAPTRHKAVVTTPVPSPTTSVTSSLSLDSVSPSYSIIHSIDSHTATVQSTTVSTPENSIPTEKPTSPVHATQFRDGIYGCIVGMVFISILFAGFLLFKRRKINQRGNLSNDRVQDHGGSGTATSAILIPDDSSEKDSGFMNDLIAELSYIGLDDMSHRGDTIDSALSGHTRISNPRMSLPSLPRSPEQTSPIMRPASAASRTTTSSCLRLPSYRAETSAGELSLAGGPMT